MRSFSSYFVESTPDRDLINEKNVYYFNSQLYFYCSIFSFMKKQSLVWVHRQRIAKNLYLFDFFLKVSLL